MSKAKSRPELDHLSVYYLFGDSDDAAKPIVYVGQTEDLRKRLDLHNSQKDFWQTAVLIISKTQSFTQAHLRYLEWYCVQQVQAVGRYSLNNTQIPTKPFLPEPMEADVLDSFETIATLVATLGFPVFESIKSHKAAARQFLNGVGVESVGELVEDGFVVRAGSMARLEVLSSAANQVSSVRSKLVESGVLVEQDGHLRFTEDYLFNTPSGAASVVLGRSANGWMEWKDEAGRTLHELRRLESELDETGDDSAVGHRFGVVPSWQGSSSKQQQRAAVGLGVAPCIRYSGWSNAAKSL